MAAASSKTPGPSNRDRAMFSLPKEPLDEEWLASLVKSHAVALISNPPLARSVSQRLANRMRLRFVGKRIDRYTDLRTFVGDPRNRVSYELSGFYALATAGGLLFIEVLELTDGVVENLQLLEPLLPRGGANWSLPDYSKFAHIPVHPDFHIVVSLPATTPPLPLSLASRLKMVDLPPQQGATIEVAPTQNTDVGPNHVLVLMKFGVQEYDRWYREMVLPVVEKMGKCFRLDIAVEDWQSEITRGIDRADAVIVDLSHDLTGGLSANVVWELNRIWQTFLEEHSDGVLRKKMLFVSRGLGNIRSRYLKDDFVYSSEFAPELISNMPTSASDIDDLLGFKVRRYDPSDAPGCVSFAGWLEDQLRPLVQNIPAPLSDSELLRGATELLSSSASADDAEWLKAISSRDFEKCDALSDKGIVPDRIVPLLGDLVGTVSVRQTVSTPAYWRLAKIALRRPGRLRDHYRKLLSTTQLSIDDPFTNNFCENVWIAFTNIDELFSQEEKLDLAELAMREQRMFIREVSDHFRYAHLPENARRETMMALLSEHMAFDRKRRP